MAKYNYSRYNKKKSYKSRKTYTTKRVKAAPKSNAKLISLIKRVQIRQSETKYKSRDLSYATINHASIAKIPIYDKDATLFPSSIFPEQGVTDAQRLGDRIVCQKMKLRLQMDVPWDRRNVKAKLYFLEFNSDQGDPGVYNQLFHQITGNPRLDPIQYKRWGKRLKYLGEYKPLDNDAMYWRNLPSSVNVGPPPANQISANTASICINKDIYFKRKINFVGDNAMTPSNISENGYLLIVPYSTANTSGDDNVILSARGCVTLYYKDL